MNRDVAGRSEPSTEAAAASALAGVLFFGHPVSRNNNPKSKACQISSSSTDLPDMC